MPTDLAKQGTDNQNFSTTAAAGQAGSLDPTINSNNLASTPAVTPVQASSAATPSISGLDSTTTATALGANEQKASDLTKAIQDLNTQDSGRAAYQIQQNDLNGVSAAQLAINDNNTAVRQLQKDAAAASQNAELSATGSAPRFVVSADQNQIERTRAVKALTLSSISDALANNLVSAQSKADKAVDAKYAPIEAEQKAKLANLQLILNDPATTLEQTKRAQAQQAIITAQAAQTAQDKTNQAAILKTAQDASTNSTNFKPITIDGAYYPTLSSALNGIATAKTPEEATRIQTITNLIPSTNKTQIIGGETGGYTSVTTDANGKVISMTPVKAGTGGGTSISLNPTQKTELLGAGETSSSINQLESDIGKYGAQYVLDNGQGLSDKTKQWIQSTYGVSPTQKGTKSGLFGLGFWGL